MNYQSHQEDSLFQRHLSEANNMMYNDLKATFGSALNMFRENKQLPLYEDLDLVYNVYNDSGSSWKDCFPCISPAYSYTFEVLLLGEDVTGINNVNSLDISKNGRFGRWHTLEGFIEPAFNRLKREMSSDGVCLSYNIQGGKCYMFSELNK